MNKDDITASRQIYIKQVSIISSTNVFKNTSFISFQIKLYVTSLMLKCKSFNLKDE